MKINEVKVQALRRIKLMRVRYIAPVVIAVIVVALMASLSGIMFWAYHYRTGRSPSRIFQNGIL